MENNEELDKLLKRALATTGEEMTAPPLSQMKMARQAVMARAEDNEERPDVITFIASFLNMKVKLYHVVLVFLLIWISYLVAQKEPALRQEVNSGGYESGLAATNNSTVLCTIRTYCLKK